MTMAILGLLAYKAVKGFTGSQPATGQPTRIPPGGNAINTGAPNSGGGLGDLLSSGLGGLLASGVAGGVLSGGLSDLLKQFQQNGHGEAVDSWVGTGPNKTISEGDLASALGGDTLNTLSQQTGMGRDDLLEGLRQYLPRFVDQLTPDGRVPNEDEAQRLI